MQERLDEAREVLAERTPRIIDDLEATIEHLRDERRRQANAAYGRVKDGIEKVAHSSNRLLDRLSETVTECDPSVSAGCWPDVTTAYEAAGRTAIAILQGPLRTMLDRVEILFNLDTNATMQKKKSSYLELRSAAQNLREGVRHFADMHNAAAEEFNACVDGSAGPMP